MESQLKPFEEYVAQLSRLGVFPSLHRFYNGWTCILRNGTNRQIMPLDKKDHCWAETMLGALVLAVESLNEHFPEPDALRKYIDTGIEAKSETVFRETEEFHRLKR